MICLGGATKIDRGRQRDIETRQSKATDIGLISVGQDRTRRERYVANVAGHHIFCPNFTASFQMASFCPFIPVALCIATAFIPSYLPARISRPPYPLHSLCPDSRRPARTWRRPFRPSPRRPATAYRACTCTHSGSLTPVMAATRAVLAVAAMSLRTWGSTTGQQGAHCFTNHWSIHKQSSAIYE